MKIKSVLRLVTFVPALMAVMVAAALLFSYNQISKIQANGDSVRQIRSSITVINHIVTSYILYHEERPKVQYEAAYVTLGGLIQNTHLDNPEQQKTLEGIDNDNKAIHELFSQLVANYDRRGSLPPGEFERIENSLVASLTLLSYNADSDAARLRSLVDAGIKETYNKTTGLVLGSVVLAFLISTPFLIGARRRITKSIDKLNEGAIQIGQGKLAFRIEDKGKDEFSDLSRAFNRMTADLKTVTASKTDLEKEVEQRRRTEELLRISESRWSTTLGSIGDAVMATDTAGKITYMNPVAENLTGWSLPESSGRPVEEVFRIINEKTRATVESPVARVLQSNLVVGLANHTVLLRRDGTEIPIDDSGAPIISERGEVSGAVLVFRDVSQRRSDENKVQAHRELLESTLNGIPAQVNLMGPDLKIRLANAAYRAIAPGKQMIGKTLEEIWPETGQDFSNLCKRVLETGKPYRVVDELNLISSSPGAPPEPRYFTWSLQVVELPEGERGILNVSYETTERKAAEDRVQRLADEWQLTFDSITDPVSIQDNDFNLIRVNKAYGDLLGMKSSDLTGRKCYEVMHGLVCHINGCPHAATVETGQSSSKEFYEPHLGIYIEASTSPIIGKNGETIGTVHIAKNITERKRMEELKDDFIGMVSHELRTPLTIIMGAVHTAMLEGLDKEEQIMLLKDAAAGAESLEAILGNLLELSRYQSSRLVLSSEPVDMHRAIYDVMERLKSASSSHRLINLAPEGISIVADKVRVSRILHNLIENAIKYSPLGGEVKVTARLEGDSMVVGVSDQGIGISAANQARLFQPFERLDPMNASVKGLGLGLVVCRRLVEAHKGTMWVESEEGKGATFYFSLPTKTEISG